MESIYTELALYGSKIECARTDNAFFPLSEVCDGTVSLANWKTLKVKKGILLIKVKSIQNDLNGQKYFQKWPKGSKWVNIYQNSSIWSIIVINGSN